MDEWTEPDSEEILASWFTDSEEPEEDEIDASNFILPPKPTHHKPGTAGKVAILRKRLEMGQLFWHPGDEDSLIKSAGFLKFTAPVAERPKPVVLVFDWKAAAEAILTRRDEVAEVVVIADTILVLGTIYKNRLPYYQDPMTLSGTQEYAVRFSGGDMVVCSVPLAGSMYTPSTFWPLSALTILR